MTNISLEEKVQRIGAALGERVSQTGRCRWMDINGIRYRYADDIDTLMIISGDKNQLIEPSVIDQINALPDGVKVIFNLGYSSNVTGLNLLLQAFTYNECNKDVIIDITHVNMKNKDNIFLDDLPSNVKVSNTEAFSSIPNFFGKSDFDYWLLNIDESRFCDLVEKLDSVSRKRALDLQDIVYSFYAKNEDVLERLSDREKCDFVYAWLRKNTRFAGDRVETLSTGEQRPIGAQISDPIETYRTGQGVCTGRSRLFKALLNNRYLNVNCFLVDGSISLTGHEWCEVYFDDGCRLYYDANLPLGDPTKLPAAYSIRDDNDAKRNGFGLVDNGLLALPERYNGMRVIPSMPPRWEIPVPPRKTPPELPKRRQPLPPREKPLVVQKQKMPLPPRRDK